MDALPGCEPIGSSSSRFTLDAPRTEVFKGVNCGVDAGSDRWAGFTLGYEETGTDKINLEFVGLALADRTLWPPSRLPEQMFPER